MPVGPFVVEQAWTDVTVTFALAPVALAVATGTTRWVHWLAGLALALKQTMVLFALLWLIAGRGWSRRSLGALVSIPLVTAVPFLVWDPAAMWEDLVWFHAATPFRADGLTLGAHLDRLVDVYIPAWVTVLGLLGALVAFAWLDRRVDTTPEGGSSRWHRFWLGFAATYLLVLLLSKHAFCNYYFLLHFLLVMALVWKRRAEAEALDSTKP